jgi:indolepyruvate ferredoxin oxidoreductase beta subunit
LNQYSKQIVSLNATQLASELGKPIVQNIIMLGVLSAVPELPLTDIAIKTALKRQFKEDFFDLNLKAYEIGRDSFNKSQ